MNEKETEIIYIPGTHADFVKFIRSLGDKAELRSNKGKFRWFVTREDGTEYIVRNYSAITFP